MLEPREFWIRATAGTFMRITHYDIYDRVKRGVMDVQIGVDAPVFVPTGDPWPARDGMS